MNLRIPAGLAVLLASLGLSAGAQVIEFESGGLKYQTQTKQGVTIMFAHLPSSIREYAVVQAAVANGSKGTWVIRPEDFSFRRGDGVIVRALPAKAVVDDFLDRGSRNDVVRLVSTYENGLYGMAQYKSTNGYEQRRQAALAEVGSTRIKAAAAASAIAFVETKLRPGDSTDGAVFFSTFGKPLGPGKLFVRCAGEVFEFTSDPNAGKPLIDRTP